MDSVLQAVAEKFKKKFTERPALILSPGRVNLIGEHTDYNEGFVLPAATDKAIVFAAAPRQDDVCHFVSLDFGQEFRCEMDALYRSPLRWPDYLLGVLDQMIRAGLHLRGVNCVFGGNIPIGAGMSSSAAVEAGLAFALNHLFRLGLDSRTLVKLAQKAENEFVGVRCGVMDQFINIHGRAGTALKLDCRSLDYEYIPFEFETLRIVVCDTLVRHELASTEYNTRRAQCEEGVSVLRGFDPSVRSLRDASLEMLADRQSAFDPVVFRRCAYVLQENRRVGEACEALSRGDITAFGRLMSASHAGLRDDYEVSCPELDVLVESASRRPGVHGSRMMGGGFGGCTINLVEDVAISEFRRVVEGEYEAAFGKRPPVHIIRSSGGTRLLDSPQGCAS